MTPRPLLIGMGWFPDQPGGLNRYVRDLTTALREDGIDVSVVALGPASDAPPEVEVVARVTDPVRRRVLAVNRAVRRRGPEATVLDAHFPLYAALPASVARTLPLVAHFHGPWAEEGDVEGQSRARVRTKRVVERAVYARAREIVTLSGAFKRVLVERYGASPWQVSVIPPGVDLERFRPVPRADARQRLGLPESAWVGLCCRRLVRRMGVDALLEAWSLLQDDAGPLLVIAGAGPERATLEARARKLGLEERVRFLGGVADDVLVDCYSAADVCIVPSLAHEGFALVILEALACGTPVVASDVGGPAETLGRFDPSLLVSAGDAGALARRLADARSGVGPLPPRAACRSFAAQYPWSRAAKRHRHLYERAAARRARHWPRVVFLDHSAELGGGEIALLRLIPELPVEAHVILAEDGPFVGRLLRDDISVEVLPLAESARLVRRRSVGRGTIWSGATLATAAHIARLARRLRRLRPDLVHTNSLKSALYGGAAGRLARAPVVWHLRDRLAEDYLPPDAIRLVRKAAHLLPSAVIANSKATLATLGPAAVPSTVVPSPVPRGLPIPVQRGAEPLTVGILGRVAPWKGQHVFLAAFARAFPDGDERAVVIGAGLFDEHEYERSIRELASELTLNGRVEFRGFRDNVAEELAGIDILVHSSVIPEPFGLAVAEGMAAGLPVIASSAGGPAEMIEDGVSGILCPPAEVEALALALRRVGSDAELRARLGQNARAAAERFAPEAVARRVVDVYSAVLDRPFASP